MKDKIFGVLQRVGRSFMLPIARGWTSAGSGKFLYQRHDH